MEYEVRKISEIDNKNIKIGKTFKYSLGSDSNYHLTNIYYINPTTNTNVSLPKETDSKKQDSLDDKTKLIFQTPLMYVPKSLIYFNEKPFLELSFNNEENDKDVSEFKKWITYLEDYIFKLIKKRTTLGIEKSNMCSILKANNNGGRVNKLIVPINTSVSKCILNDDCNNKKSKILFNWEIPTPTYAISIIWIKNIWVKNGKWGINLFMYTSRVMNSHMLDPIDFMGLDSNNKTIKTNDIIKQFKPDDNASIQIGQVPEYIMYFKMLKLGIPKDAVKQKMSLLNLDTRYIDYPDTTPYITVIHYISNPKLGPYIKPNDNALHNMSNNMPNNISSLPVRPNIQLDLLKNISGGGFKLKKVDINESISEDSKKEKILSKLVKTGSNGLKVPSLGDIQGALSRLKKVDLESEL
jgi:hypothetical protein